MDSVSNIMYRFETYIINPAILVIFALGFLLFVYGLVEFLWKLNEGGDTEEGKQHMIWGIVGMLIMVSVFGILELLDNTFGLDFRNPDVSRGYQLRHLPNVYLITLPSKLLPTKYPAMDAMMGRPTSLDIYPATIKSAITARIARPTRICPTARIDWSIIFAMLIGLPELAKIFCAATVSATKYVATTPTTATQKIISIIVVIYCLPP